MSNSLIDELVDRIWKAQRAWHWWTAIFGSQEIVNRVNSACPSIFGYLQNSLFDAICLDIWNLLDRGKSDRLTLSQAINQLSDPRDKKRLKDRLDAARANAQHIERVRHHSIAHWNLHASLSEEAAISVSLAEIQEALDEVILIASEIKQAIQNGTIGAYSDCLDEAAEEVDRLVHMFRACPDVSFDAP